MTLVASGVLYDCPTCATQFTSVEHLCNHLTDDPHCNGVPVPLAICQPAGPGEERTARYHENSGSIYGFHQPNSFERMKAHDYEAHRAHNVYYPFADREEWELAKFLSDNLNQGQITRFLKLLWVKSETRKPLAYKSAQQMFTFMDALPKGPKWRCTTIHTKGYITTHPVHLIWHDALEVMWHIFGNPVFANDMEFDPYKIQDQLPSGATIVPIVLASDKTLVTRQSGGLKMHPMFLTTANIRSDIRMKATSHAWSCIAYMPIPQFICHPDFCSLLQARVWHWCVDIICENLKITAATGTSMVDPSGHSRYAFTPLVAYTADLPEQQMIVCVSKNASPITLATQSQFGDGVSYPPRHGNIMIEVLHQLCQHEAKSLYLSGVQLPFWHNWRFSDPAYFLAPDILHTLHKFFFDHIFKWCKEVLGADELDSRFHRQHKCVSHVQKMTGREHRDIQRTIVATLVGVADANFIQAIPQSPTFTLSSITAMTSSLEEFHRFKRAIISAEAHRGTSGPIEHFEIPKLELLTSFARAIPNLGAPIQFTSETSERMLITHCKGPFTRTSHQRASFMQQIYALLRSKSLSINNLIDNEFEEVVDIDPAFDWIMRVSPEEVSRFHGPRPVHNHFLKGLLSEDSRVAFHVTVSSDLADKSPNFLVWLYHLPNFPNLLHAFIERVNVSGSHFQMRLLKVWNKFRLQLHSDLRPRLVMPSQQVQVYPPSGAYPLGNYQVVVAQVRMVFGLSTRGSALPPGLSEPLLYVQLFEVISRPQDDHAVMMYCVKRRFKTSPDGTRARLGMIIPLVDVTHAIELIPEYGQRVNHNVTAATSLELYDTFYLNSFSDKEWYHALHADFY
ncbi:uncharacterized protein F5891DRAFT_1129890 [Suillus fuscotomentosus]|uniref:C2H2-type domain-containing protein n=1 Tax=Suillus fuscotomentosus TaxID=1912939 RepID=A0AAD4E1H5_9AGAM|nr:uncharacterized protein F5891DRAFT_1129890 [Suillus fuscotomentosus]KAG1897602.1 hypothetical protein F5891DRAFT_1129890 [Suillus fuscotomentosus]